MGVVQAIKLMRSSVTGQIPALPMAQVAVNLSDKILFVGLDGTTNNVIKFVAMSALTHVGKVAVTQPANGATLTILDGKTLTVNNSITLSGTDGSTLNIGAGGDLGTGAFASVYSLPTATASIKGGIKVGTGLSIASEKLSVSYGTAEGTACQGNDARLSDARTPVAHTLDGHSNVVITSIASGEILKWNGSNWINNTLVEAGILATSGGTLTDTLTTRLLKPSANATYDIGLTGTRYRDLYLSGAVNAGGDAAIGGNLTVGGDLVVNGDTVTVNVSTMTLEDPIITLGGTAPPTTQDLKDRGIEFHWYSGSAKVGFFGFDQSEGKFTFIPDATNNSEVFSGTVGTIVANIEGDVTGNASTATKVNKAVTFNNSGNGVASGTSFDGSTARIISYNTIGAAALAGSTDQDFSTNNLSVLGNLGVSGTTTLGGGVGITSGALTMSGKTGMLTPYVDFRYGTSGTYSSRIIEDAIKELSIYGGASADGKIKLKSDTYVEKALYIGGASGAKIVFVAASGGVPAYLKLQNYDGGVMHFVTTGGQTMYSTSVPAEGGGGSSTVILNGATENYPAFYAPTSFGSPGQYLVSGGENVAPSWITMPTATSLVAGIMKLGASGGAATYEHGHSFASLSSRPNTLGGYDITDAAPLTHVGAGAGAHAVVTTSVNGFMSATDKTKLDHLYPVIYNAGAAAGKTLADASESIPAYLYNTRSMLLIFGDANEQYVYLWIATTNIVAGNKDNPAYWLRISKPDVDGGTY